MALQEGTLREDLDANKAMHKQRLNTPEIVRVKYSPNEVSEQKRTPDEESTALRYRSHDGD